MFLLSSKDLCSLLILEASPVRWPISLSSRAMRCFTDSTSPSLARPRAWMQNKTNIRNNNNNKEASTSSYDTTYVHGFQLLCNSFEHSPRVVLLILVFLQFIIQLCQLQLCITNLENGTTLQPISVSNLDLCYLSVFFLDIKRAKSNDENGHVFKY